MTRLLVFTWPYTLCFWAVFIAAFGPESRVVSGKREPATTPHDAFSKPLIVVGQGVAIFAAFAIAIAVPSAALPHRVRLFWLGLIAIAGGSLLRRHCFRMLGSSFTGAVVVTPEQAGAIMFAGTGLVLGNWIGIAVLMIVVAIAYGYRVRVEERALAEVIGEPYRRYMRRTKRFVPFAF